MKKRGFIITETIFSLVLAASVTAVAVLAVDLNTNQFQLDRFNPFRQESSVVEDDEIVPDKKNEQQSTEEKSVSKTEQNESSKEEEPKESSAEPSEEESDKEKSGADESSAESSKESSSDSKENEIKLRAEPEKLESQPKELADQMAAYSFDIDTQLLGDRLIMLDTVNSGSKDKAILYCFQKSENGMWWNIIGDGQPVTTEAYIGENGSGFMPERDSKVTPGGIFYAGTGFYISDKPDTTYDMFQITENTYWVTDPDSQYYNQKVEGTENKDWTKADHMITSEKPYKYGLVVNYNTFEPDSSLASAIFIHCGNAPTEGSIAVPENVMKTILEWCNDKSTVNIFVNI
ncbi:MAG: hypothetical protein IJU51_02440 [Clostridia bacterium]|nr:hypothetical protein [Clostridia bacterium]